MGQLGEYIHSVVSPGYDFWKIFGGDKEAGLPLRPEADGDPRVIRESSYMGGGYRPEFPGRCDGAPRGLLDFDIDESPAARVAASEWLRWNSFIAQYPPIRALRDFIADHAGKAVGERIKSARAEFSAQSAIRAYCDSLGLDGSRFLWQFDDEPVAHFGRNLALYVEQRISLKITTDSLVKLDGEWLDLGDSRQADPLLISVERGELEKVYRVQARAYLHSLPADCTLVRVKARS